MKKENIITNELKPEETIDIKKILSAKVLSKTGYVIGNVNQVKINQKTFKIEGVTVKLHLFEKIYIGSGYIDSISNSAIILNVELSLLIRNKKVIDGEGSVIGKVKEVVRKDERNDIDKIIVSSFMKKDVEIPINAIKTISKSVILREDYDVKQRYFWKKS